MSHSFEIPVSSTPRRTRFSAVRSLRSGFGLGRAAGLIVLILVNLSASTAEAQTTAPAITSPAADQAVKALVTITGSTGITSFASAELDFAYPDDPTNTWFLIQTLSQPVADGTLVGWDTTGITDGRYVMRLRVFATDGGFRDATVPFEIANYTVPVQASATPAPTNAPSVEIPTPLLIAASATPTPIAIPTPTPLPPNPAGLQPDVVYGGLVRGALFALAAAMVLGALLLRRRS